jgi:hypothetical protein
VITIQGRMSDKFKEKVGKPNPGYVTPPDYGHFACPEAFRSFCSPENQNHR